MKLNPTEASKVAGVTRKTLYADMQKGVLSFELTDKKKRLIQVSELERVYGKQMQDKKKSDPEMLPHIQGERSVNTAELHLENRILEQKVSLLEAERLREREQMSDQIDHLKTMLGSEQEERRKMTALLTDQSQEEHNSGPSREETSQMKKNMLILQKQNRRIMKELEQKPEGIWRKIWG